MPLPFFHSTTGLGAYFGLPYTRMKGIILSGTLGSTVAGPIEGPAGIALIQPALVCSTAGQAAQVLSTVPAAGAAANFIYISQSTAAISTSSDAAGSSTSTGFGVPPQTGMGAAIHWNAGAQKFAVYSTVNASWMYSAAFTSSA